MNSDDTFAAPDPLQKLRAQFNELQTQFNRMVTLAAQSGSNIELAVLVDTLRQERDHYRNLSLQQAQKIEQWRLQCSQIRAQHDKLIESNAFINGTNNLIIRVEPISGELTAAFQARDPYPNE